MPNRPSQSIIIRVILALGIAADVGVTWAATVPPDAPARIIEGDYVARDFSFASGEQLPELRMHYSALGTPHRGATGHIDNAVLLLHGIGGSGRSLLVDRFAGVLFGKGQLLDANRYYILLPDAIGHGSSSKPSDGLHAKFPHYTYEDMVNAQYVLLTTGLQVDHLRLVLGASMGCMHAFLWGEKHPEFVDALMPLACLPVPITGRNRVWRELLIQAIESDPDWQQGDYKTEPVRALRTAAGMLLVAGSAPIQMQLSLPTRAAADEFVQKYLARELEDLDANDVLYQVESSRDYDPSAGLEMIPMPVMWINSGDDFVNPPELAIAEREVKRLPKGHFVLLPASDQTHGHGTHTWAAVWQEYLAQLLAASKP